MKRDRNSTAEKLRRVHEFTGIPINTLWSRVQRDVPLDAPYKARDTEEARIDKKKRAQARRLRLTTYEARPCDKCGGTIRYVSSRTCVVCAGERSKQQSRDKRLAQRDVFRGDYHMACGTYMRYKLDGACVKCSEKKPKKDHKLRFVGDE
jgi:hypothetical protein